MSFHVGQRVTMKHNHGYWSDLDPGVVAPEFGVVYMVRDIESDDESSWLRFREIRNPVVSSHDGTIAEPWFDARQFRPVVERKTDISIFTAMLDTTKHKESV